MPPRFHKKRNLPPPRADKATLAAGVDEAMEAAAELTHSDLEDESPDHLRYRLSRDAKERLDKNLQAHIRHASRHQIQKLIALGGVRVNGKSAKPSTKLKAGDIVDVIVPPRPTKEFKPEPIPLDVLYEDDSFIVVNKQAGLIVHPARGQMTGTLINGLAYHFQQQASNTPSTPKVSHEDGSVEGLSSLGVDDARPGIVHRLDRNTTGVMIVAKQDEPHWKLARQFEDRTNLKAYLAVVHGCPDPPGGAVEQPIAKHPTIREAMAVRNDSTAKHALTLYRVRERYKGYSLVELELKTGRTHQIRVHLSFLGHPIVGDILYGGEPIGDRELDTPPLPAAHRAMMTYARPKAEGDKLEADALARDDIYMTTPALHAALLGIRHPMRNDEEMIFTAPIHSSMRTLIDKLRERPDEGPVVTSGYWVDLDRALP
ncbi:RluA family pseudouridine synthase [Phycisphaerales bacterium AB-hyl4]|uniref:RluA family pseudouridine synthase n=1 Tax=Natronomicrosphaera hydrolytica TaxID=3242702 RepID=A0ABV4TZE6_9BACT